MEAIKLKLKLKLKLYSWQLYLKVMKRNVVLSVLGLHKLQFLLGSAIVSDWKSDKLLRNAKSHNLIQSRSSDVYLSHNDCLA